MTGGIILVMAKKIFNFLAAAFILSVPFFVLAADSPLIDEPEDVVKAAENFVVWMYRVFWVVAVGFVIWSAFLFLNAGGDAEKVSKAKTMLLYALIAAAIVLLANNIDLIVKNLLNP